MNVGIAQMTTSHYITLDQNKCIFCVVFVQNVRAKQTPCLVFHSSRYYREHDVVYGQLMQSMHKLYKTIKLVLVANIYYILFLQCLELEFSIFNRCVYDCICYFLLGCYELYYNCSNAMFYVLWEISTTIVKPSCFHRKFALCVHCVETK